MIGEALHCAVRIDTNPIPAAVRKAWLQMELAAVTADNPERPAHQGPATGGERGRRGALRRRSPKRPLPPHAAVPRAVGRPQRSVVLRRVQRHGRRSLLRPVLPGVRSGIGAAHRRPARPEWAAEAKRRKALEEVIPSAFHGSDAAAEIAWWNQEAGNFDFLGNEFLLWLWWRWETQSDTITLPDDSEVTGMFARTLSLQCPRDESGKETITAEAPVRLPEAAQAIRTGKLPRKAGLMLVRHGEQYDLMLQAETFTVSGAKIRVGDRGDGGGARSPGRPHRERARVARDGRSALPGFLRAADRQELVRRVGTDAPLAEDGRDQDEEAGGVVGRPRWLSPLPQGRCQGMTEDYARSASSDRLCRQRPHVRSELHLSRHGGGRQRQRESPVR